MLRNVVTCCAIVLPHFRHDVFRLEHISRPSELARRSPVGALVWCLVFACLPALRCDDKQDVMLGGMQLDTDANGGTHGTCARSTCIVNTFNMLCCAGTVVPLAGFDAEQDAKDLLKAFKGVGCNRKTIINVC